MLATREEYRSLAEALRASGSTTIPTSTEGNPAPYGEFLQRILITNTKGEEKVSIILDSERRTLEFRGSSRWLALLAVNVGSFGPEAEAHHHSHIEYPNDDFYLAKDSVPIILEFSG